MPDINSLLDAILGTANRSVEGTMDPQPSDYRRMNPGFPLSFNQRTGETPVGKPGAPTMTQQAIQGLLTALGGIRAGPSMMPIGTSRIPRPPVSGQRLNIDTNDYHAHIANSYNPEGLIPWVNRNVGTIPEQPRPNLPPQRPVAPIFERQPATQQPTLNQLIDEYEGRLFTLNRALANPNLSQETRNAVQTAMTNERDIYNRLLVHWSIVRRPDQHRPHSGAPDPFMRSRTAYTNALVEDMGGRRRIGQRQAEQTANKGPGDLTNPRDIDALVRNHYESRAPTQNQMRTFMSREMGYDLSSRRTAGSGTVYQHYLDRQPNLPGLTRNNYPQLPPFNRYELRYADHPGASYSRSSNSSVAPVTTIRTDPQYIVRNNVTTARGPSTFELIRNMVRSRHGLPITRISSRPNPPSPDQLNFFDLLGGQ